MLSVKAATAKLPPLILRGCYKQVPATSVAIARIISARQCQQNNSFPPSRARYFNTTALNSTEFHNKTPLINTIRSIESRRLSTHPICEPINSNIAKDLSAEEYDQAYKFVYHQHAHPHGPWLKFLHSAQKALHGSAHSSPKCIEWASHRFQKLGLNNIFTRLVPEVEDLSTFKTASFDLVITGMGFANASNPKTALKEIHRLLAPGGTYLSAVWEQAPADVVTLF